MGRAVNNKLIVALSIIGFQQSSATIETEDAIEQLIDYVATYPDNGIIFRKSGMILATHADAGFLKKHKSRRKSGAHVFPSENNPKPKLNGPVLTIAQIIKYVMASTAGDEMETLYITAKNMIQLHKTLIEMGWPQPMSPIQTDNSTSSGFT